MKNINPVAFTALFLTLSSLSFAGNTAAKGLQDILPGFSDPPAGTRAMEGFTVLVSVMNIPQTGQPAVGVPGVKFKVYVNNALATAGITDTKGFAEVPLQRPASNNKVKVVLEDGSNQEQTMPDSDFPPDHLIFKFQ